MYNEIKKKLQLKLLPVAGLPPVAGGGLDVGHYIWHTLTPMVAAAGACGCRWLMWLPLAPVAAADHRQM